MSVYKKIALVMQDVQYLSKDDKVEFGNTKYKAISEEKVTSAIRKSMVAHGLIMFPTKTEYTRAGNIGQVHVSYKIVDTEDDSFIEIQSVGEGADSQDKASGKAQTYAFKYALLRTFMIPTGEDPDKTSSAELDAKMKNEEEKKAQKKIIDDIEAMKFDYPDIVNRTVEELEKKAKMKLDKMPVAYLQKAQVLVQTAIADHIKQQKGEK
jgi:hypothetical protein